MKRTTERLRAMKHALRFLALIGSGLVSVGLGGCAGGGAGTDTRSGAMNARAMYVTVYIQSGPKSGEGTKEAREAMFRGQAAGAGAETDRIIAAAATLRVANF